MRGSTGNEPSAYLTGGIEFTPSERPGSRDCVTRSTICWSLRLEEDQDSFSTVCCPRCDLAAIGFTQRLRGRHPSSLPHGPGGGSVSARWFSVVLATDERREYRRDRRLHTTSGRHLMLKQVAEGVLVHESEFIQSNSVVVQGRDGVLLIDPGITSDEMAELANDLRELGQPVVAGFSTHPDWDHVLWHASFGDAPRYGTARCAAALRDLLSHADWTDRVAEGLPPEYAEDIPMDLLGLVTGLPATAAQIPWDGPKVRILEHQAHAPGHAALLIEEPRVLVAGDMLSDILMPFLDLEAANPLDDYLAALELFESVADDIDAVIPGHGSVGGADQLRARIGQDRAYVQDLRDGRDPDDPRVGPSAPLEWLPDVHSWQLQRLAQREQTPE